MDRKTLDRVKEFIEEVTVSCPMNNIHVRDLYQPYVLWCMHKRIIDVFNTNYNLFIDSIPKGLVRRRYICNISLKHPYDLCLLHNMELVEVFLLNMTVESKNSKILTCVLFDQYTDWFKKTLGTKILSIENIHFSYDKIMDGFKTMLRWLHKLDDEGMYVLGVQLYRGPPRALDKNIGITNSHHKSRIYNFLDEVLEGKMKEEECIEIKSLFQYIIDGSMRIIGSAIVCHEYHF